MLRRFCFSLLEAHWNKAFDRWRKNNPKKAVTKVNVYNDSEKHDRKWHADGNKKWSQDNRNLFIRCKHYRLLKVKGSRHQPYVSNGTAWNEAANVALPNLSINDPHQIVINEVMKKVVNTQHPSSEILQDFCRLYKLQEKTSNIET